jgi:UDP-N-acetylglucosamine 2-epimerase (non-hydrolysing)
LHFAPTEISRKNLLRENKPTGNIIVTGNTAIDALKITVRDNYENKLTEWVKDDRLILLTSHRRENLGSPMRNVFRAVLTLTKKFPNIKVIYPVHKNQAVRKVADEILSNSTKIQLVEPLDVLEFHNLMNKAYFIMSDSGGIQEEAPSLGKPVLVTRDTTERPEGVTAGTLKLVGTDYDLIVREASILLSDKTTYEKMSKATNPYGDGHASKRIVDALIKRFSNVQENL